MCTLCGAPHKVQYLESDLILSVETEGLTRKGITPKRLKIKNRKSTRLQERREIWLGFSWWPGKARYRHASTRFEGRRTSSGLSLSTGWSSPGSRGRDSRELSPSRSRLQDRHGAPPLSHTPPLGGSPEFIWSPGEPKAPIHWRWERIPMIRSDSR